MAGMHERFNSELINIMNTKKANSGFLTKVCYDGLLRKVKFTKNKCSGKKPDDYRTLKRYDVMKVDNVEKIIVPGSEGTSNVRFYVYLEEIFPILHETHISIGHGGRNRMFKELQKKYKNITAEQVMIYLNLCESCQNKSKVPKKGRVVRPMVFQETNSRCQTSPQTSSQIQTFENGYNKINHENLEENFILYNDKTYSNQDYILAHSTDDEHTTENKDPDSEKSTFYNDEACSNQDYVLGHSMNDKHATENKDQESGSAVKVEDESIECESYETGDFFKSEINCNPEFQNEEINSTNIISSSDCRISTDRSVSVSKGVLHSSTEQSMYPEVLLRDSTAVFHNRDSDEEADSAFCSYILKEMRCVRNKYKKRLLKMNIVSEIMNAQQDSA